MHWWKRTTEQGWNRRGVYFRPPTPENVEQVRQACKGYDKLSWSTNNLRKKYLTWRGWKKQRKSDDDTEEKRCREIGISTLTTVVEAARRRRNTNRQRYEVTLAINETYVCMRTANLAATQNDSPNFVFCIFRPWISAEGAIKKYAHDTSPYQ